MNKKSIDSTYRDQEWLENLLADIWYRYFSDVDQSNKVVIRYGRKAKRRLGSISLDPNDQLTSIITINPIYQDLSVPEYVVVATIVHEMTHYAHGFNSPLDQRHQHPHSGGIIKAEFAERGLEDMFVKQRKWLKTNWPTMVERYFGPQMPKFRYTSPKKVPIPKWFRI
ncbi:hypothetical protein HYX70_03505 [Candidatus Saccharibacteria bacterium]|nr:hypothetical protein [Candidatus Saccharibacteria bacterium]